MEESKLKNILNKFKNGEISEDEIIPLLKKLPYEDINFAKLDYHRSLRQGLPEVIFAEGKSIKQISKIFTTMRKYSDNILITRTREEVFSKLQEIEKNLVYNEEARCISFSKSPMQKTGGKIAIVTAGTSDIPVAEEARFTAEFFGNEVFTIYDIGVAGLHRLLDNIEKIRSADVIIVVAGMEGALPSVIGGLVDKVVIAVPSDVGYGTNFGGLTPLFGMLNSCSPNVLVVNVNNGFGAAYSATLINLNCGKNKSK